MPYSSPQILTLEAIRDWMATLSVWSEWVGSADVPTLKSRVVWPLQAAPTLPVCVLNLEAGQFINLTGAAGGANFHPGGVVQAMFYAADTDTADPQVGYSDFADLLFRLLAEMTDNAHAAPVYFNAFEIPPAGILHSSWINTEEEADGLAAYWMGQINIRWGVEA